MTVLEKVMLIIFGLFIAFCFYTEPKIDKVAIASAEAQSNPTVIIDAGHAALENTID